MQNKMRIVIKLGGSSLQDPATLQAVTETVREFRKYDHSVVIVHGGGPSINEALSERGIRWQFIQGQRQTTPEMMSIIEEVLAGKINTDLALYLNQSGIPSVGFSGAECETLFCEQANVELGQVGRILQVNTLWIERLLAASGAVVPVIAPIGIGAGGEKYNINADWAAAKLAMALRAEKLLFLTDQKGILNPHGELIEQVDASSLAELVEKKIVTGGMHTKVLTVLDALKNGVHEVRVMNGRDVESGLWSDKIGTFAHA